MEECVIALDEARRLTNISTRGTTAGPRSSCIPLARRRIQSGKALKRKNRRADYVKEVLDKLINWDFAAENLG